MIIFKTTREEFNLIQQIADRGWRLGWLRASYENHKAIAMDVTAVHANGNPLRLEALLEADEFNFAHDMSGIRNCLNRETGRLAGTFCPRFSL